MSVSVLSCQDKSAFVPEEMLLQDNWILFSSDEIKADGKEISSPAFNPEEVYPTSVPNTVLAALVDNEVYTNIHMGDNFGKIPKEPFTVPWWYRKTFTIQSGENETQRLVFEGINYRANVWLNGQIIASADTMEGCFRMFDFDVSEQIKQGENILAVEVIPPKDQELTIGFVDWNPWPADNNLGLWRPVKLVKSGAVAIKNLYVKPTLNTETLNEASLQISAELFNYSDESVSGELVCEIENIKISQTYSIGPKSKTKVILSPDEHSVLNIENPRIWWPHNLGEPNLYEINATATIANNVTDSKSTRFGIRSVEDYINEKGHRGYIVNGKKILIKGGGWVDDVMLADDDNKVEAQIQYVKNMNMNTIRLEGFWGRNKKIYDLADENGILVMIGWSCQWEWEGYCGRPEDDTYMSIFTPEDVALHSRSYMDQVRWLRNHPSVFLWVFGSDKLVIPELEQKLIDFIAKEDGTRPTLGACKYQTSELTGFTAVKMLGPYKYVTPNYWYLDTKNGGAYGFNTETGPGCQPPPLESIKKMIPEDKLWPMNEIWDYHTGRNEFATFRDWIKPFNARYGEAENVEEFAFNAQLSNYEAIRAMFEAFAVNKHNATGVIQWMLNSAVPNMLWQVYDWYLMPTGAFYGTMHGCEPLNLVYNYKDKSIYLTNEFHEAKDQLTAEIKLLDFNSKVILEKEVETNVGENTAVKIFEMPSLSGLTSVYFVDLKLKDNSGKLVSENFYWLSSKEDVLDFEKTEWHLTPNKQYADFSALKNLPETSVEINHEFVDNGDKQEIKVVASNPSDRLAFFIELALTDQATGQTVLPTFWEDNYISLLPGESKEVKGYVNKENLTGAPGFRYQGLNVK